jgi:heme/copper-type cytochrome/quinol oxidase subunit 2
MMEPALISLSARVRILLIFVAGLLVSFAPLPVTITAPQERTVRVHASSFQFDPGVVRVNQGDRVTLELVSMDVVHGIYIDGYGLTLNADPGQIQYLTFVAEQSGSFRLRCSVSCGALHPFMIGKLIVGDNLLLWRAGGWVTLAILAGLFIFPNKQSY